MMEGSLGYVSKLGDPKLLKRHGSQPWMDEINPPT